MKTLLFLFLMLAAVLAKASPDERADEQGKGVDLLTIGCIHDAYRNLVIILPDKTPFDAEPDARKRYLDAYTDGFRSGYTGRLSVHETTPQPLLTGELEGWSAGQWTGYRAHQKEELSHLHQ